MKSLYIGLMSGTSMDGIDAGLCEIDDRHCLVKATTKFDYPAGLRQELQTASRNPDVCTVDTLGRLDNWVGECFMHAAEKLIKDHGIDRSRIRAIGSHGQTIRHQPHAARPFSMQIGDPNLIAAGTGVTTVADFRRRDLALGGEGAPLATAFHKWLLSDPHENRIVLNIGGIANITVLPAQDGEVFGFDTGPGNTLLDAFIQHSQNQPFDLDGTWADSGKVDQDLLDVFLRDPYFQAPPPKSTGFEYFNMKWLEDAQSALPSREQPAAEDVQATLTALSARSVADAIRKHAPDTARILVCGGGVRNASLMRRLNAELAPIEVETTTRYGIHPDWVEAAAFAWLAKRCLDRQPGNLPAVTGASRETILGGIYPCP